MANEESISRATTPTGIGAPVKRVEDERLLTGCGRFVDDLKLPNAAVGCVVRSPHAHAKILGIDASAAQAAPGVLAVLTGADLVRDNVAPLPSLTFPTPAQGKGYCRPTWTVLATDRVRYMGEAVAFIVAESLAQAKDAAELLSVEYEPLPVVAFPRDPGEQADTVWPDAPDNVSFELAKGDEAGVARVIARASHVTKLSIRYPRASANAIEPRAAAAFRDPMSGRYTIYSSTQSPFRVREIVAAALGMPQLDIRVVAPDVGGGFGMKSQTYPEEVLTLWAARRLDRTVKWTGDRSEAISSDTHGRDQVSEAEIALDADGRILAMRVSVEVNLGAYLVLAVGSAAGNATNSYSSTYVVPLVHAKVRGIFSNTCPVGPYRGSGKPEANFTVERLLDKAAYELKMDPVELRRRNLVSASAMPYRAQGDHVYDTGEFEAVLDQTLILADWKGFEARRAESERRGLRRGIGLAMHCHRAGNQSERMEIRVAPDGVVALYVGTHSHGQGHETMFAQMISEWLGVPFDKVCVLQGDTDRVLFGRGTFAQRSMLAGGSALKLAADNVIEKGKRIAAWQLEASVGDIEYERGTFRVKGTDREMGLSDVARLSYRPIGLPAELGIGLDGVGTHPGPNTYPNGCMICEVEVDTETGAVEILKISAVDDAGRAINPLTLRGQLHGSTAQGVGEALFEQAVYDRDTGQLLTGSFMDYAMPRAEDIPSIVSALHEVPAQTNPLGVKGGSEAGNVGAPPAVIHAVLNALSPWAIVDLALPATPERIWRTIHCRTS